MKKLLLASNGGFLIERGYRLLDIPKDRIKIAWVTTASKGVEDLSYLDRHKQTMLDFGYDFEAFDIERKTEKELYNFFQNKNVIHVEGGNAFYLLKAVKESGFDVISKELIAQGMIYAGTSAGAYIACPTIEMATWGPHIWPDQGLTDLRALNLVPFLLRVHYEDSFKSLLQGKITQCQYPVRILRDGQGILVQDDSYTFVGEGTEVILNN